MPSSPGGIKPTPARGCGHWELALLSTQAWRGCVFACRSSRRGASLPLAQRRWPPEPSGDACATDRAARGEREAFQALCIPPPPPQLIPAPVPTPGYEETGVLPVPARRSPTCLRRKAAGRPAQASSPARPPSEQLPQGFRQPGRRPPSEPRFPAATPQMAAGASRRSESRRQEALRQRAPRRAAPAASAGRPAAPRPAAAAASGRLPPSSGPAPGHGSFPVPAARRRTGRSSAVGRENSEDSLGGARSGAGIGTRRGVWAGRLGATSAKVWGLEAAAFTLPPEGPAVRGQLSAASRSEPAAAPTKAPASGRLCPAASGAEEGLEGAKIAEAAGRKAEEPVAVTWAPTPRRNEGPGLLTPVLPTCTHRSVVPESGHVGTTQGMS